MKHSLAFLTAACVASPAFAATTFMSLDLQVFDGTAWVDTLNAMPGSSVSCRMRVSFDLASGVVDSWGAAFLSQISVGSSKVGDSITVNTAATLAVPATQNIALVNAGLATAKIDRTDIPSGNMQFSQNHTGLGGNSANPIDVFFFTYNTTASDSSTRLVSLELSTVASFAFAAIFTDNVGSNTVVPPANRSWNGATIVVPAPSAAALLFGLGGLAASRRRRS